MTKLVFRLENVAIWLENGCDVKHAISELKLIIGELRTVEPKGELEAKLREIADSQTELDPQARHVLYSRMRELYLK